MKKQTEKQWNQWLAGLIDGDGYFYLDSKKRAGFEITMHIDDEHILQQIKQRFPGSLKTRAGVRAMRLRISKQEIIFELIKCLNGEIRDWTRQDQFLKLCDHFGIAFEPPSILTPDNHYLSGRFDSDGTICFSVSKTSQVLSNLAGTEGKIQRLQYSRGYHQLSLGITSKHKEILEEIVAVYGLGIIYTQAINKEKRRPNVLYKWVCRDEKNLIAFWYYSKRSPIRSIKRFRVFLIPAYFELFNKKAHLNLNDKCWEKFCSQWYKG